MRNRQLYKISVFRKGKLVFQVRDSLHQLNGTLNNLARDLCPELGLKGKVDHENVTYETLQDPRMRLVLLEYLAQDVLLLAGIMQKAQSIYHNLFQIDFTTKLTVSALAMDVFCSYFYDDQEFPIHIPTRRIDSFKKARQADFHNAGNKPILTCLVPSR